MTEVRRFEGSAVIILTSFFISILQSCSLFIALIGQVFSVGRNPLSDYCLDDSTLNKNRCKFCSREHFRIIRQETKTVMYVVSLLDTSVSGTYINRNLVGRNKYRPLAHGDRISVGKRDFDGRR